MFALRFPNDLRHLLYRKCRTTPRRNTATMPKSRDNSLMSIMDGGCFVAAKESIGRTVTKRLRNLCRVSRFVFTVLHLPVSIHIAVRTVPQFRKQFGGILQNGFKPHTVKHRSDELQGLILHLRHDYFNVRVMRVERLAIDRGRFCCLSLSVFTVILRLLCIIINICYLCQE